MATSDNAFDTVENGRTARSFLPDISRYDLVLAVIPSVFVIAAFLGQLLSLSVQTSIGVASLLIVSTVPIYRCDRTPWSKLHEPCFVLLSRTQSCGRSGTDVQ